VNILVLASTYPRSAEDTTPGFVHELSRRLVGLGHEVVVLTPHLPDSATDEVMDGVRVRRFRYGLERHETLIGQGGIVSRLRERPLRVLLVPLLLVAYAIALLRMGRGRRFDVVHAHWIIPQGLLAALLLPLLGGTPLVCTAHGGDLFALRAPAFRALRRLVTARSACVTVVSHHMRDVLTREGVPADRIRVASMGVDLQTRFVPVPGVARDPAKVIFVGRLVEKKGVRHLLDAMRLVHASHPHVRLDIVGDGPERVALEAQSARLGLADCVNFLGGKPQSALPQLYSAAAIAVVPSVVDRGGDQEGLGLVTVEAIGCGCAVVVSDLEAIRDVVTDGVNGLVTRAADATSLANAIVRLLDSPALGTQLAARARADALEKFDWQAVTGRYGQLFEQVLT